MGVVRTVVPTRRTLYRVIPPNSDELHPTPGLKITFRQSAMVVFLRNNQYSGAVCLIVFFLVSFRARGGGFFFAGKPEKFIPILRGVRLLRKHEGAGI